MIRLSRVNLALMGVVAVLALAVAFGPDPAREKAPAQLTGLDPESLRSIRIDRGGDGTLGFERDSGGWDMIAPYRIAAKGDKLQALARIASTPSHRSFPTAQTEIAELGLATASLRLKLNDLTLEIGGTEPIRHRRYVQLEGRIHLIDDLFQHHLLAAPEAFVASTPFTTAIRSATLDGVPLTPRALRFLTNLQARIVESGDPPGDGHRLEVRMEDAGSPLRFSLETAGERLWREHPPLLYRLETPVTPDLLLD